VRLGLSLSAFLVGAGDLVRVKEGSHNTLTSIFAFQAIFELSQEFRLVPLGSIGSLAWC